MGHTCCGRGNHGKKPLVNAELIGVTVEEFKAKVGAARVRQVSIDGAAQVGTCDFRPERYNLTVVGGKVVSYRMG